MVEALKTCNTFTDSGYCLDTEISPPYPESWRAGVYKQTFPQDIEGDAGFPQTEAVPLLTQRAEFHGLCPWVNEKVAI